MEGENEQRARISVHELISGMFWQLYNISHHPKHVADDIYLSTDNLLFEESVDFEGLLIDSIDSIISDVILPKSRIGIFS